MSRRWNAPAEVLRRLLDISSSLPIEEGSEVTPIQVWHMISQGPDYSRMKVAHLVWMSDRLLRVSVIVHLDSRSERKTDVRSSHD